jgi:hypothetical protein
MPQPPPTLYSTALFDPIGQRQLRFLVVPDRSLPEEVESAQQVAASLGVGDWRPLDPLEAWSLPFLLDAMSGRGREFLDYPFRFEIPWRQLLGPRRGHSQFAQYAVYAPVLRVEALPVRGRSMAGLLTKGARRPP